MNRVRARSLVLVALTLALGACGTATTTAPATPTAVTSPTPVPTPTPDLGLFDIDLAMEHIRVLSVDIGYRPAGSEGDARAAEYIAGQIEALGWRAERRPFPLPQGGESWNVVGIPPGFSDSAPYLLVGGHYDSIGGPGANDNATGVAAMLEIGRAVMARAAPLPVMVVAFGAEEVQPAPGRPHHIGSVHYVANMSQEARDNLVAMINIDMVGHGDVIYCGRMNVGPREGTERCLAVAEELGIDARERVTPNWSDNGSFLREGLNAGWLWTGENPCCYHNEHDTIENVRSDDVRRAGEIALGMVRSYGR